VVADEESGIESDTESLELTQAAFHPRFQCGSAMNIFVTEVAHVTMGVRYDNIHSPSLEGALNRSVYIASHDLAKGVVGWHAAKNLLDLFHARDPFHIHRDEDSHSISSYL
jgi:hypothetical protein